MPKKYLRGGIFTHLHRLKQCSSSENNLHRGIETLKTIFDKNNYPRGLVESTIKCFLENPEKPPKEDLHHTVCLPYNSHRVATIMRGLIKKMKKVTPEFHVNLAYRSIRVSNLFSGRAKPLRPIYDTNNVVYKFQCFCSSSYVGQTDRPLAVRIGEHFTRVNLLSSDPDARKNRIINHIDNCEKYIKNQRTYLRDSKTPRSNEAQKAAKLEFFKSNFSVLKKNFRTYSERLDSEAYFIRTHNPDLNDQKEHVSFSLF